jgi:hypothetical protein
VAGLTTDPVAGLTADPVAGLTADPVAELTADPMAGLTGDPVFEPTADPAFEPMAGAPIPLTTTRTTTSTRLLEPPVDDRVDVPPLELNVDATPEPPADDTLEPTRNTCTLAVLSEYINEIHVHGLGYRCSVQVWSSL